MFLLVGNWSPEAGEKGISVYEYEASDGSLAFLNRSLENIAASTLAASPYPSLAYATHETDAVTDGMPQNQIIALDLSDLRTGVKAAVRKPSYGPNPSWVCTSYNNSHILIPHHGGFGNVSTVSRNKNGALEENIRYDSPHVVLYRLTPDGLPDVPADAYLPTRLTYYPGQISRSHIVRKAPGKNLYMICDKGLDEVLSVTIDFVNERIVLLDSISVPQYSAPRHGIFHETLPVFYADMENKPVITAFSYNQKGNMKLLQTLDLTDAVLEAAHLAELADPVPAFPGHPYFEGAMPSNIILTPDGNGLCAGLRGVNLIALIGLNEDGRMSLRQLAPHPDGAPHSLAFSPDGKYLFTASVFDRTVCRYSFAEEGNLRYEGIAARELCPASLLFFAK